MRKYILTVDQGTTSTRALLLDKEGTCLFKAQRELPCLYPHPGHVEMDAEKIWISVVDVINELRILGGVSFKDIAVLAITNQRETTIVWDKNTGKPIYNAIVWQSRQSEEICNRYQEFTHLLQEKTGLRLNPYFSASKIRYILEHVPGAEEKAKRGELLFGTVDSWLIYNLTEGKKHLTDITNASRTMLFNIHTLSWDKQLCDLFQIPVCMLPEVKENATDFGIASFLDSDLHIYAVAGDQESALFGQCCFNKGESKNTYGTGCFMLMNTGSSPVTSKGGLLTTIAWKIQGEVTYALEGSVFIGGAIVQWLRDEMRWFKESMESEEYAERREEMKGIYFVPAFVGLGAPYWDDKVRGAIFGLTRGSDRHHITRAALQAIAYESKDVIELMKQEAGLDLPVLKVDGGASANGLLMQFQADILQTKVELPAMIETTALGVAYMAGLASGLFRDLEAIKKARKVSKVYVPSMSKEEVDSRYKGWKSAVAGARLFQSDDE